MRSAYQLGDYIGIGYFDGSVRWRHPQYNIGITWVDGVGSAPAKTIPVLRALLLLGDLP